MIYDLSDKSVLIYDNGWYTDLGPRLAEDFGTVFYFAPYQRAFPTAADAGVGMGLEDEGVIRVEDPWRVIPSVDLIVFPDLYNPDLQVELRRQGKRVWGTGPAEKFERDRIAFKHLLESHHLPVIPYQVVVGMDALERELRSREKCWVKLAKGYRGDTETFQHLTWDASRSWFYPLQVRLGAMAERTVFLVEESVEGFEGGFDLFSIDGEYPREMVIGYEIKDSLYVAHVVPTFPIAKPFRGILEMLEGVFVHGRYRQMLSTEVRIDSKTGTAYFIDLCARFPSPPVASEMNNISNFSSILYYGAEGILIEPEFIAPYAVELKGHTSLLEHTWQPIKIDPEDRKWVYISGTVKMNGMYYSPMQPQGEPGEIPIVSVVALGNTLEEARELAKERAERVEGKGLRFEFGDLDKAEEEIKEGEKHGIRF